MYLDRNARLQEEQAMVDKWSWLTEGIEDKSEVVTTSMVLQNSYESMIAEGQLAEGWLESLLNEDELNEAPQLSTAVGSNVIPKVLFPVIRRVMPSLIANQLVSVQPISARTGIIYNIAYTYSDTKGNITSGDEYTGENILNSPGFASFYSSEKIGPFTVTTAATGVNTQVVTNTLAFFGTDASAFSIKRVEVYKADGTAYATVLDETAATIDFGVTGSNVGYDSDAGEVILLAGSATAAPWGFDEADLTVYLVYDQEGSSKIPEMEFSINSQTVDTTERKLKIRWTKEAEQDMKSFHKIDVESELVKVASMEMNYEIDRELLAYISNIVPAALSFTHKWDNDAIGDGSGAGGNNTSGNYLDRHRALAQKMSLVGAKVAQYNRQGAANWAVVSPQIASVLSTLPNFKGEISGTNINIHMAGILGNLKIYVDPNNVSNEILMGFKSGSSTYGAGVVYSPYTNWMSNTVTHPDNFNSIRGFFSRYAVTKVVRGEYFYSKLTVENLTF